MEFAYLLGRLLFLNDIAPFRQLLFSLVTETPTNGSNMVRIWTFVGVVHKLPFARRKGRWAKARFLRELLPEACESRGIGEHPENRPQQSELGDVVLVWSPHIAGDRVWVSAVVKPRVDVHWNEGQE
jgi:hypothetical protein